jgi:hypothetical protein
MGIARRRWVAARLRELLPVPYYHVVFTLPHRLNDLALYNKQIIYNLFYRAAAYTLLKFGNDPKYLGAWLGFIGVLHTWGKELCYHIHWHFIIPGGGLTPEGKWLHLPYSDKFLFPPKAMSKVIRARFIKLLRQAYNKGQLIIPDSCEALTSPVMFEYFLNDVASDKWINHVKRPFGGAEQVVKYIGRYTHRVALSNNRLIDINGGCIRFYGKNYKKDGIIEKFELPANEFIRRFLLHTLPRRFKKMRYGGFLSPAIRHEKLAEIRQSLGHEVCDALTDSIAVNGISDNLELTDWEKDGIGKCPQCHIGTLIAKDIERDFMRHNWLAYLNSS